MKRRIAIIGSGISGLTAAYHLSRNNDIMVYEANDYIGGHTHTVDVELPGQHLKIDTGFIVCNNRNYPNFLRLLEEINVNYKPTEMSFSVVSKSRNLEYNGHSLDTLFAQRSNIARPKFLKMVRDILAFNKAAKKALNTPADNEGKTLDEFLLAHGFTGWVRECYVLPMTAAIWSCSTDGAGLFPLQFFLQFFSNHGLLDIKNRPQWYVIEGGSSAYIEPLTAHFADDILLSTPVKKVMRNANGSVAVIANNETTEFDEVIFACHSDQALAMLDQPTEQENAVLGALHYQSNDVILHTDARMMPSRKKAWAAWNYYLDMQGSDNDQLPIVTYCMNILQGLTTKTPLLVSLNADHLIDPSKIIQRFDYAHPQYHPGTTAAQAQWGSISGHHNTHYCGAYWYNGFHEDGVRSALDVVDTLVKSTKTPA